MEKVDAHVGGWLSSSDAIVAGGVTNQPGAFGIMKNNLWSGFAIEPSPGDKHQLFLEHTRTVLCNDVPANYEYLMSWMARAVQTPNTPGEVAIILRGSKGTGKSLLAKTFGKLFGRHFVQISGARDIGKLPRSLLDCIVLFGDEAFSTGNKGHERVLNTLITEEEFVVERMGVDPVVAKNRVHLIMASNEQWVVPASYDALRFLVLEVSAAHMQDVEYFGSIDADLKAGGLANLLHALQTRDLSNFDVRTVPTHHA